MKEGETVSNYFSCTLIIATKMCFHGEIMTDVIIIEKILRYIEKTWKLFPLMNCKVAYWFKNNTCNDILWQSKH
jgi:hypothetical protein